MSETGDIFKITLRARRWSDIQGVAFDGEVFYSPETSRQRVEPTEQGVEIPVDKTKYKIRFADETEDHVHIIIEPKE